MKRILTALLALLLALSFSVTGFAEESVIQETHEVREEPAIQETPAIQNDSEVQVTPEVQENPKPENSPKSQESPKPEITPKPQESPDVPVEYPTLEKEECETYAEFFRETAGLNNAAIAGILANMQRESSFDPKMEGDDGKAFGLCQWNEYRQKRLNALCERTKLCRDDISTQQIFLIAEMQVYYPGVWNALQWLEETEDEAAWAAGSFCRNYEKPADADKEQAIREQLARAYFYLLTE